MKIDFHRLKLWDEEIKGLLPNMEESGNGKNNLLINM